MATVITTINATDLITNSRVDINNNFSSLNTNKIETSVLVTDGTFAANLDTNVPSQKAVKTYVDNTVNGSTIVAPTAQTYSPAAAGTASLDTSLSTEHFITMPAGNITIAVSVATNNVMFIVAITQDSVGSRTATWFTTIKWAGGSAPTLTTTANKRDIVAFIRTGAGTYDGFVVAQNI